MTFLCMKETRIWDIDTSQACKVKYILMRGLGAVGKMLVLWHSFSHLPVLFLPLTTVLSCHPFQGYSELFSPLSWSYQQIVARGSC